MFYERNQLNDIKYPSYLVFNSGIDVEFITLHKNPEDWTFSQNDFTNPTVDKDEVIFYNTYGNSFTKDNQVKESDDTEINCKYYPTTPIDPNLLSFDIYRVTPNQKYMQYIGPLQNNKALYDYGIASNNYYQYLAVAQAKSHDSYEFTFYIQKSAENDEDSYYHTQFSSWTITDIIEHNMSGIQNSKITEGDKIYYQTGKVWRLGLNMENPTISQNYGVSNWDTQGRFSKTSIGNKRYDSSRFSSLLGNIYEYTDNYFEGNGNYQSSRPKLTYGYTERMERYIGNEATLGTSCMSDDWSVEQEYGYEMAKLEAWNEFITNGSLKLLKDIKGNKWIIQVVDNPEYNILQNSNLKQTQISFSWKEVDDAKECSFISYENLTDK